MSQAEQVGRLFGMLLCSGASLLGLAAVIVGLVYAIRRRSTVWIIVTSVLGLPVIVACALMALTILMRMAGLPSRSPATAVAGDAEPGSMRTIIASDGQSRVRIPENWKPMTSLHEFADLQVGDRRIAAYLIVLTEDKRDVALDTLDEFAKNRLDAILSKSSDATVSEPTASEIGGSRALQFEIRTTVEKVHLVYILTCVEGSRNFHQILAWTLPSKFDANRSQLKSIIESFEEIQVSSPASKVGAVARTR